MQQRLYSKNKIWPGNRVLTREVFNYWQKRNIIFLTVFSHAGQDKHDLWLDTVSLKSFYNIPSMHLAYISSYRKAFTCNNKLCCPYWPNMATLSHRTMLFHAQICSASSQCLASSKGHRCAAAAAYSDICLQRIITLKKDCLPFRNVGCLLNKLNKLVSDLLRGIWFDCFDSHIRLLSS